MWLQWGKLNRSTVVIKNDGRLSHITSILPRTAETRERSTSPCLPSTNRMASLMSRYEGSAVSQPAQRLLLAVWRTRTEKNIFQPGEGGLVAGVNDKSIPFQRL